jgi:hypothetical protein
VSEEKAISGVLGGALAGGLISAIGLMRIKSTTITSSKTIIAQQTLDANSTTTLLSSTTYKFAIMLFHGDGDPQIQLSITVGSNSYTLNGDEQAIELIVGEQVSITATNTDTANPHNTPTIEIAHITWVIS